MGGYGQQDNYGASGANPAASGNYNDNSGFNQGGTGLAAQSRVDDQAMYQGNQQGMHEGHHKHHHHHQGQQQGAGFNQNTPAYDQTTGQGYGGDNNNSSYTPGSGDANKTAGMFKPPFTLHVLHILTSLTRPSQLEYDEQT